MDLRPNPACGHAHMQAVASPQDYNSTQDTLQSNFDFHHFTQILHSLKISGGPLAHHFGSPAQSWMPLVVEMTLEDMTKLFYFMTFS